MIRIVIVVRIARNVVMRIVVWVVLNDVAGGGYLLERRSGVNGHFAKNSKNFACAKSAQ